MEGEGGGKVIDFFNKRFLWFATGQGIDDSHGIQQISGLDIAYALSGTCEVLVVCKVWEGGLLDWYAVFFFSVGVVVLDKGGYDIGQYA